MRYICILILMAMLAGCGHKQTVQIRDVAKPETIVLRAERGQSKSMIHGLALHFRGQIDGEAMVTSTNIPYKRLSGKFDFNGGSDWYSDTCVLDYSPTNVHSGQVIIEYEFYD